MTMTPVEAANPSSSVRSWLTACLEWAGSFALRLAPTESSSSMKMIAGDFFLAAANSSRILLAPTPTNLK